MGAIILSRIIPVIVVDNGQAFHMIRFKKNKYLGDPINICRLFNEKNCDELVILDISKNQNDTLLGSGKLEKLSENVFVPISYGGGLKSEKDISDAFGAGIEKIVVKYGSKTFLEVASLCAQIYGEQSVVLSINITSERRFLSSKNEFVPLRKLEDELNALNTRYFGEILVQAVDQCGSDSGINEVITRIAVNAIDKPVIYSGGVRSFEDVIKLIDYGVEAVAISTLFSLHQATGAQLISYFDEETRSRINKIK